jgi:glycosyltransferase involved in cell wall biosynthesis
MNYIKPYINQKNGGTLGNSNSSQDTQLSLIIPCFNEEGNIRELLARTSMLLANEPLAEVIFVNNGSTDSTGSLLEDENQNQPRARVLHLSENKGYGFGIKKGLEESTGRIVGWTHADLQTDPMDALRALQQASKFTDNFLIKGRRTQRPLLDLVFTLGMSVFESTLFRVSLKDINAQPTLFTRDLLPMVLEGPDDFSLDLYTMVKASQAKYIQIRFPVYFGPRFSGSSKWNTSMAARVRFIKRTLDFSFALAKNQKNR